MNKFFEERFTQHRGSLALGQRLEDEALHTGNVKFNSIIFFNVFERRPDDLSLTKKVLEFKELFRISLSFEDLFNETLMIA